MALKSIIINGSKYNYWEPDSYTDMKLYIKQCKRIREKIQGLSSNGCYKDKYTRAGKPVYADYPELLAFLEGLIKEKTE
jgi:hypothetical protein